jgi:hypothetical protein
MANEAVPVFTVPNRDALAKNSGRIFQLAVLGIAGFAAYVYLLPFLIGIAVGSIEFFLAAGVALFLGYIFTQKKFWRALSYYSQWIAEKMLGLAIEMNRWQILYNQVDERAKALENVRIQNQMLRGQQLTAAKEIQENNTAMREAAAEIDILKQRISQAKTQDQVDDFNMQLETATTNFNNAKGFIDDVQGTLNGLNTLVTTTDKIYRKGTNTIVNLRATIKSLKTRYDITDSGSRAMQSARIALNGNPGTQDDANKAFDSITKTIGIQLGVITQGIQETTRLMDASDLKDAAKIQMAAKVAEEFNADDKFRYSDSISGTGSTGIPQATSGNKFIDLLK